MALIRTAYLDTSVFGGYFDEEFPADTIPFFERISDERIVVIVSELLEAELAQAPDFVRKLLKLFEGQTLQVDVTTEVEHLAKTYVNEKVVGMTSYLDCVHIALATVNKADILAS